MINTPGSFVGFFELISQVLNDLGDEWIAHAALNKDDMAKEWGNILLLTSATTRGISEALSKIRNEHDERENFKNKVAEIKGI